MPVLPHAHQIGGIVMPLEHVEEDSHYIEDWEETQDKLEEIKKKHNNLVNFLKQFYPAIQKEPQEFLIEYFQPPQNKNHNDIE